MRSRKKGRRVALLLGVITAVVTLSQAPKIFDFFFTIESVRGRWNCSEMGPRESTDRLGPGRVYEMVELVENEARLHYRESGKFIIEFFRLEVGRGELRLYGIGDGDLRHEIPARSQGDDLILELDGRPVHFRRDVDPRAPTEPPVAVN